MIRNKPWHGRWYKNHVYLIHSKQVKHVTHDVIENSPGLRYCMAMISHRYKTFVCLCRKRNKNPKDTSFEGIGCHYVSSHQVYCLMVPLILNFLFDEKTKPTQPIQNQPTFPTQLNKHETPRNETKRNETRGLPRYKRCSWMIWYLEKFTTSPWALLVLRE